MTSFGSQARSAVIWNTAFNLFRDLLQFGTMLVLVRILKPESYGQFAMVGSVMGFLSIFSHNNFIAHILQVKGEADARYQEHFTASAVIQAGIFLISNAVAMALYWVPTYASIAPFLHVMSISFLLEWPYELRRRMLERQFNWKKLRLLQAIGLIISAILALAMAWMGAGTYTLLVPGLLATLPFIYDLFVIEGWRPTWAWSWDRYRPAWRFGSARTIGGLAVRSRQLMESGILTAVAGFAMLGMFNRSIGLAQMFCQKFSEQLLTAIYPILTRIDGRDRDPSRIGGLVLRIIAWVAIPIAIVFSSLAEPVVNTVYGSQWGKVVALLPWAMAWGALSALSHATYMLLLAKHQTRMCTHLDLGMLVATGAALLGILPYGLTAYLAIVAVLQLTAAAVMMRWLMRLDALSWHGIADAFMPPIVAGLSAWLGANLLTIQVIGAAPMSFGTAFFWGAMFSILYLGVLRIGFARQMANLVAYLPAHQKISKALALKTAS
jgi:O-antigen/teichoic acid export membrane protein